MHNLDDIFLFILNTQGCVIQRARKEKSFLIKDEWYEDRSDCLIFPIINFTLSHFDYCAFIYLTPPFLYRVHQLNQTCWRATFRSNKRPLWTDVSSLPRGMCGFFAILKKTQKPKQWGARSTIVESGRQAVMIVSSGSLATLVVTE